MMSKIPKRETPPDEKGYYYYQNEELRRTFDSMAVHIVMVYRLVSDPRLRGSVMNMRVRDMDRTLIAEFPSGDWYGPLPLPDLEGGQHE